MKGGLTDHLDLRLQRLKAGIVEPEEMAVAGNDAVDTFQRQRTNM
jgi:hypothetical protein